MAPTPAPITKALRAAAALGSGGGVSELSRFGIGGGFSTGTAVRYLFASVCITATAWALRWSAIGVLVLSSPVPMVFWTVSEIPLPSCSQKPGSSGMSCLAWSMASDIICSVLAASLA